jgi:hypothetical protein
MMNELNRMQKKWQEESKPPLSIGINSSDMVVGNMGS